MLRNIRLDVSQEAQKLLMPVPSLALRADLAIGDVQRSEQSRGVVSDVIMSYSFEVAQTHRQHGLRALRPRY